MATYRGNTSRDLGKTTTPKKNIVGYKWINRICVIAIIILVVMIIIFNQQYTSLLR